MVDRFDPNDYEVVWSGKDELLPPRTSHPDPTWEPGKRLYNKKQDQAFDEDNDGVTASDELQQNRREDSDGT